MGSRRSTMWGAFALALVWAANAVAQDMRIQFAEKVAIAAVAGHAEFDAYGRRFALTLEPNLRLLTALPAPRKGETTPQLWRGRLDGVPRSWVRLTRVAGGLEGAIWDGRDLYVVTRHASISAHLTLPLQAQPSDTVVYRLSDARNLLPEKYCGLEAKAPTGTADVSALDAYKSMVSELRVSAAAAAPTDQLDVALIADPEFQINYGGNARDTMLARLNTTDGIFSEQVGVLLAPGVIRLVPTANNPLTSSVPDQLLDQLSAFRTGDAEVRAAGLAHLMTGKTLNGDIVGIAFLDALCDASEGVSLSESAYGEFAGALVMAHELGHNFGARHDGVAGSGCESVPQTFLMAPSLNYSTQFSQCSLDAMRPRIEQARGRCIGPAQYADVGIQLPPSPLDTVDTSAEFSLPVTINATGTVATRNVRATIDIAQLAYRSAVIANGSCSAAGNIVTCNLGDIPSGEQRTIDLRLIGTALGTFTVQANVAADNDRFASDNSASVQVGLRSAVDLSVTLTPSATLVYESDPIDFTIDLGSLRSQKVSGGWLTLNTFGISVESIDAGAHACQLVPNSYQLSCQLADIAAGATSRIVVHARATQPGFFSVDARVDVTNDGDYSNNYRNVRVEVRAEREVRVSAPTESLRAVVGELYDLTFTLTSVGRLAADNVTLSVQHPFDGHFESVQPSVGSCADQAGQGNFDCDFGSLNSGAIVTVLVRLRMDGSTTSSLNVSARYTAGSSQGWTTAYTWIYANQRIDASASLSGAGTTDEGQLATGSILVQTMGVDPAQNVVATLDMPAPARLTQLVFYVGPAGWTCSILTPQQGQCTGSFAGGNASNQAFIQFAYVSDAVMSANVKLTVAAAGDGDSTNDIATTPVNVLPYLDVGLTSASTELPLKVGEVTTASMTLTTGRNPVPGISISADSLSSVTLDSISVNGANCPLVSPLPSPSCQVGDLPANASLPVVVRYRASQADAGYAYVRVFTQRDSYPANNAVTFHYVVTQDTDVRLSVSRTAVTAVNGTTLAFPTITVTGGTATANNVKVSVPIPNFASVQSVSTNLGLCNGTTTFFCNVSSLPAGATWTIDIMLNATGTGTSSSNVTVAAANDATPGNNSADVSLTVTAPATSSGGGGSSSGGSSSGGGKGGGRIEWLVLALLGLLMLRRMCAVKHYKHVMNSSLRETSSGVVTPT